MPYVCFSYLSEHIQQRNGYEPLKIDCSTFHQRHSHHMIRFSKKHATISIKLLRQRTSFVVSLKQPFSRLMFSLRLQRWFMSCYNLIQVFWSTAIVFLNHLFIPKTWASAHILSDYVESSENRTETAIKFVILAFHIGKGWGIIAESGSKFNDAHLSDNPRRKLY